MKNTTQQPLKWKWTGPIDMSGKFHSAEKGKVKQYLYLICSWPQNSEVLPRGPWPERHKLSAHNN